MTYIIFKPDFVGYFWESLKTLYDESRGTN